MSISAISGERLDLLPISSHVGPLQVIVSEGHLAGVASIFVGMSGSGHGNGLRAMIPRSVWGDGSHIDCTQISQGGGRKGETRVGASSRSVRQSQYNELPLKHGLS